METKGIIQAVSNKNGKYGIKLNDEWYNGFNDSPVKKGDEVVLEFEENGIYKNVKNVQVSKEATNKFEEAGNSKIASMIISYAKDLVVADKIQVDEIDQYSRSLMNLYDELSGKSKKEIPQEPKKEIEVVKI